MLAWLLVLAGCTEHVSLRPSRLQAFAPWTETIPQHRLQAGDDIELKFLFNTELNDRLTIGPDGQVTVPLLGPVPAQGKTVPEFTAMLREGYSHSLRVPDLDVIMRSYNGERIYVGGEVQKPGMIILSSRVGVLQSILLAGGLLPTARQGKVAVVRRNDQNQPMLRLVDIRNLIGDPAALVQQDAGQGGDDIPLQAGDVVYVTRSNIAEIDLFVDQYINQALPFQKTLNANLLNAGTN